MNVCTQRTAKCILNIAVLFVRDNRTDRKLATEWIFTKETQHVIASRSANNIPRPQKSAWAFSNHCPPPQGNHDATCNITDPLDLSSSFV